MEGDVSTISGTPRLAVRTERTGRSSGHKVERGFGASGSSFLICIFFKFAFCFLI